MLHMKISRRSILKISGFSILALTALPRMAFAARNTLRSLRTGVQPGGKTRLVIETATRPSYSLSYPSGQMIVTLSNTAANTGLSPKLASGTLVKSLAQAQSGDTLQIIVNLNQSITPVQKSQIMVLEPNGDNDYRLVLDFVAGNGVATTIASANTNADKKTAAKSKKYVVVIDAGHGGKDPGCIGRGGTREKDVVLSVARKLKSQLDTNGFQTYLTRSGDTYLKLAERAFAQAQKAAFRVLPPLISPFPSARRKEAQIYRMLSAFLSLQAVGSPQRRRGVCSLPHNLIFGLPRRAVP